MFLPRTLRVTPMRLAQLQSGDVPQPLPPELWVILTDRRWSELRWNFDLPEIGNDVAIRAYMEWTCIGRIDCREELRTQGQFKLDDDVVRWMSKASNVGKPLPRAYGEGVIERLSYVGKRLNRATGRRIVRPDELPRAKVLTIRRQLCALVCWNLGGHARRRQHAPVIIEFYAALWWVWELYLGRQATLWAHEERASEYVRFVTCLLRLSQEPMPDDDAIAWKNALGFAACRAPRHYPFRHARGPR